MGKQEGELMQPHISSIWSCDALVKPQPCFQHQEAIHVQLDQPLIGPPDIRQLVALCAIADAHIQRVLYAQTSDHFDDNVLAEVDAACHAYSTKKAPSEVLESLGLFEMFPYLAQGFSSGQLQLERNNAGTAYLSYVSCVNQLVMLATQIYHDAVQPSNHKYIAHQLALLYQCLNQLQGDTKPIRRLIEARFEEVKIITESSRPVFNIEVSEWLQEVSWTCREEAKNCPAYMHKRFADMMSVVRHERKKTPGSP